MSLIASLLLVSTLAAQSAGVMPSDPTPEPPPTLLLSGNPGEAVPPRDIFVERSYVVTPNLVELGSFSPSRVRSASKRRH